MAHGRRDIDGLWHEGELASLDGMGVVRHLVGQRLDGLHHRQQLLLLGIYRWAGWPRHSMELVRWLHVVWKSCHGVCRSQTRSRKWLKSYGRDLTVQKAVAKECPIIRRGSATGTSLAEVQWGISRVIVKKPIIKIKTRKSKNKEQARIVVGQKQKLVGSLNLLSRRTRNSA